MEQMNLWDLDDTFDSMKPIKSNDWKWSFKDYPPKNGLKVFSCFACGGGSTMGYKLAGCEVLGCCEIDKRMNDVYVANHHPKYNYLMDIRDFNNKDDLPDELYNLDILDGSPPCSTFSMAGDREKGWGKEKKFREGQKLQTLDDLLFVFIETVNKLKPKVAIMENVEGLILGEAWSYVQEIYKKFKEIGYSVRHKLFKCEQMGVPQTRHRVFFIATRLDFDLNKIDFHFNYLPITFGEIKEGVGKPARTEKQIALLNEVKIEEKTLEFAYLRLYGKRSMFNSKMFVEDRVCGTITAGHGVTFRFKEKTHCSDEDIRNAQTFPTDYNFINQSVEYICGMSVPPVMIKRIVERIIESGIFDQCTHHK